jgi:hypothetical protein
MMVLGEDVRAHPMPRPFTDGVVLLALLSSLSCEAPTRLAQEPADLILRNGNVITLDPARPQVEAIAVLKDRIVAVGTPAEIDAWRGEATHVLDLQGRTAVPGLIDAHLHFPGVGERAKQVFLDRARSEDEALEIVEKEVRKAPAGAWVTGQGWHTVGWDTARYPDNQKLTRIAPAHPVYLVGMASHAAWVNEAALARAGITRDTADPPGGEILRHPETGVPTGILLETAMDLVSALIPPPDREARKENIRESVRIAGRLGLTGVHDAGIDREVLQLYKELLEENALQTRVYAMLSVPDAGAVLADYLKQPPLIGLGDNRLTVRCFKAFADGALGARGAALLDPYSDSPTHTGLVQNSEDELYRLVEKAGRAGYQVAIHAIGDRGNRMALNAIERAEKDLTGQDLRPRIEHSQILSLADIPRFAPLGVVASMQPIHATMDMGFAETRVGPERIKGGYAWRSLLRAGARVAAGSDTPAFPIGYDNPLWGIHAAVTRQDNQGQPPEGWYPAERVERLDALRMYTIHPAYAAFEEKDKGSLTPGKLADVTVLSKDILTIPAAEILQTEVVLTVLGGTIVFQK